VIAGIGREPSARLLVVGLRRFLLVPLAVGRARGAALKAVKKAIGGRFESWIEPPETVVGEVVERLRPV
jgi:hypothetical protein